MRVKLNYNVFSFDNLPEEGRTVEVRRPDKPLGEDIIIGAVRHASDEPGAVVYADVGGYELQEGDLWVYEDDYHSALDNPEPY